MTEREKRKSHPGLKSGSFVQLTSCLCQEGSSACPQLTLAGQALCKWEAVSMSAHLSPSVKKKEGKEKKKNSRHHHQKTPRAINSSRLPQSRGSRWGTSCLPFKLSTPMPITSLMTRTQLWKKSGVTKNSKYLQDNFPNRWSREMLFFFKANLLWWENRKEKPTS